MQNIFKRTTRTPVTSVTRADSINRGKTGRPCGFDKDDALEAAMRVFWEKSYEGATLTDLTEAMGINRSSMYAAFGDKESLFELTVARYAEGPVSYMQEALKRRTIRAAVEALLRGTAEFLGTPGNPRGCLIVHGALATGVDHEAARQATIQWRRRGEAAVRLRILEARRKGELAPRVDPADYARFLGTIVAGLAVQAVNGATKAELHRIVDISLELMAYEPAKSSRRSARRFRVSKKSAHREGSAIT
jgi:AcrR family transcriptional regulator